MNSPVHTLIYYGTVSEMYLVKGMIVEFLDFLGECGCDGAKSRHLGIRKRSSEQIAVLQCCSVAVGKGK